MPIAEPLEVVLKEELEMARQWQFVQDEQQQWHWKHLENQEESSKSFPTAAECMLDAVRCAVQRRRAEADSGGKNLLQ